MESEVINPCSQKKSIVTRSYAAVVKHSQSQEGTASDKKPYKSLRRDVNAAMQNFEDESNHHSFAGKNYDPAGVRKQYKNCRSGSYIQCSARFAEKSVKSENELMQKLLYEAIAKSKKSEEYNEYLVKQNQFLQKQIFDMQNVHEEMIKCEAHKTSDGRLQMTKSNEYKFMQKSRILNAKADDLEVVKRMRNEKSQIRKTCRYNIKGICKFGIRCKNLHVPVSCKYYAENRCWFGKSCFNIHKAEINSNLWNAQIHETLCTEEYTAKARKQNKDVTDEAIKSEEAAENHSETEINDDTQNKQIETFSATKLSKVYHQNAEAVNTVVEVKDNHESNDMKMLKPLEKEEVEVIKLDQKKNDEAMTAPCESRAANYAEDIEELYKPSQKQMATLMDKMGDLIVMKMNPVEIHENLNRLGIGKDCNTWSWEALQKANIEKEKLVSVKREDVTLWLNPMNSVSYK